MTQDTASNTLVTSMRGRVSINLWPGDNGPNGVVSEPGLLLVAVRGSVHSTFDFATSSYTAFALQGQVTDVCAVLDGSQPVGQARKFALVSAPR